MEEYAYVVNVDAAVLRDDEYLFIERGAEEEHASELLAFPGGKVEQAPGAAAPIETTAAREVAEEVGVDVENVEYVLSRTFEADTGMQCINVVTLCEYAGGQAHPRDAEEVAAVEWLSADEVRHCNDVPDYLEADVREVDAFRTG